MEKQNRIYRTTRHSRDPPGPIRSKIHRTPSSEICQGLKLKILLANTAKRKVDRDAVRDKLLTNNKGFKRSKPVNVESKSEYKKIVSTMDKENRDIKHLHEIIPVAPGGTRIDDDNRKDEDNTSSNPPDIAKYPPRLTKSSQSFNERKGKGCRNESGNASEGGPEEYPDAPSNTQGDQESQQCHISSHIGTQKIHWGSLEKCSRKHSSPYF